MPPLNAPVTRPMCRLFLFSLLALGLAGCSDGRLPTYPVEGQVVFDDGRPVRTGFIEFLSDEHGINARGTIARDGTFQLTTYQTDDGAVGGRHQAVILQFLAQENVPGIRHDHGDPVSLKHSDYDTSGLEFVVEPNRSNSLRVVVERQ
jgi:hypothetical protein